MEERGRQDDEHWEHVMENLDLLFSKVVEIDTNQQKMNTKFDMSTKVMEEVNSYCRNRLKPQGKL